VTFHETGRKTWKKSLPAQGICNGTGKKTGHDKRKENFNNRVAGGTPPAPGRGKYPPIVRRLSIGKGIAGDRKSLGAERGDVSSAKRQGEAVILVGAHQKGRKGTHREVHRLKVTKDWSGKGTI